jgi:dihydroorotate dehydrogenase
LSGAPLADKSTQIIRKFYVLTNGTIPIIGVGGISTAQDAYTKIRAGASLVQIYSGLVYEGATIVKTIRQELESLLIADGYANLEQAIGSDHKTTNGEAHVKSA